VPLGKYTFRVVAGSSDGIWNLEGEGLAITVLAPFYETWWFAALVCVVAVTVTIFAWKYRVSQLDRARAAQQAFSQQLIASQDAQR
jgi:heme/copper-type cytochrome/quinol oxidase subunit 2